MLEEEAEKVLVLEQHGLLNDLHVRLRLLQRLNARQQKLTDARGRLRQGRKQPVEM